MTNPDLDPKLVEFATNRELDYIEAIKKHGSRRAAASALKCGASTIDDAMRRLKKRAAQRGHSPEHDMRHVVPDGFKIKGVSTYYGEDGKPKGQWVKSTADQERMQQIVQEAATALAEELPRLPPVASPAQVKSSLCNVYTLTDSHVGMLAWHREGGADWDLGIAEKTLIGCFESMVASAPPAHTAVVNQLGDFLHYDSLEAVTPTSKHIVDSDGRFSKIVRVALRILRHVIDFALHKHERVVVLLCEGNHDLASSVWLRAMFSALYENEPRVTVIDSDLPYYVHEHGATMLCFHHGHLSKNDRLPLLFAAQFPEAWGRTRKRYCHVGHRHHVEEKEHSGMRVIQHSTLAARDAYAARGGWLSERQVTAITYHSEHGDVARTTVTPEMLS